MDRSVSYSGLRENGGSLPGFINLELENNKIYGTVPESSYETVSVWVLCFDEFATSESQTFKMVFNKNNNPVQVVTDFTPYTIKVAEGVDSTYTFPSGLYADPDNDKIYFQL